MIASHCHWAPIVGCFLLLATGEGDTQKEHPPSGLAWRQEHCKVSDNSPGTVFFLLFISAFFVLLRTYFWCSTKMDVLGFNAFLKGILSVVIAFVSIVALHNRAVPGW